MDAESGQSRNVLTTANDGTTDGRAGKLGAVPRRPSLLSTERDGVRQQAACSKRINYCTNTSNRIEHMLSNVTFTKLGQHRVQRTCYGTAQTGYSSHKF